MKQGINRLLAFVLSFAMVLTGFTFLGGSIAVNAADGDKPEIGDVYILSANEQPAKDGSYKWAFFGVDDTVDWSGVTSADFGMELKVGDGDWTTTTDASVTLETSDDYDGVITATVPDNTDSVVKQWRFTYSGGIIDYNDEPIDAPAITQAAGEATANAKPATVYMFRGDGVEEFQKASGGTYKWIAQNEDYEIIYGDNYKPMIELVDENDFQMQMKDVSAEKWDDVDAKLSFAKYVDADGEEDPEKVEITAEIPENTDDYDKQWVLYYKHSEYSTQVESCSSITITQMKPEGQPVVTFDAAGGTVEPASAETVDGKLSSLPEATREGFAFLGWFTEEEGGDAVTTETVFAENATVYAHWLDASEWEATDFTYGAWTWGAKDGLYCASNTSDIIAPELWVVTGLSDSGKAKLKAGNTKLVIPAADSKGKKVQGVGSSAFYYRSALQPEGLPKLTEVVFPEVDRVPMEKPEWNVNNTEDRGDFFIGASAFLGNDIEKVDFADGVVYIGGSAFNTNKLKEITFPVSISYIGSQAFAKNSELATLNFPDKTDLELQVDAGTFGLSVIEAVQMPPTLTKLNQNAFMKAKGQPIVEITIDGKIGPYVATSKYHNVTKISHTITFDAGEGTTETTSAETFKNKLEVLPEATREGTVLLGWFTEEEGGDAVTTETVFAENATVYAHWDESLIDVTEKIKDAEAVNEEAQAACDALGEEPTDEAIKAAEEKTEAAAKAADDAVKAAEAAKEKQAEGSDGAAVADNLVKEAQAASADANSMLATAKTAATKAAAAKAAEAKAKADEAAKTVGDAAIEAAKEAETAAKEAATKADEAAKAAEAAAEAAKAAYGENSGEYKAAAEKAKEAEQAKADADKAASDATDAVKAAEKAKADAEKAKADAAAAAKVQSVTTVTVNAKTVNAAAVDAAVAAAGGSKDYVTTIVLGKKVKKIKANTFKNYNKVTTLEVQTKKLTKKSVKKSLKGSAVKTVKVKVAKKAATNKKYVKKY